MARRVTRSIGCLALAGALWAWAGCRAATEVPGEPRSSSPVVRVAVFNTALSRDEPGALAEAVGDFGQGDLAPREAWQPDPKIAAIVEVLARVDPAVVVLLEVDADAAERLAEGLPRHLPDGEGWAAQRLAYSQVYVPEVNTGVPSSVDLDRDGRVGGPGDAYGWGRYPGHYGLVVLAKDGVLIDRGAIRTFRNLKWIEFPGNVMPIDWYGDAAAHVRLSSKTHADVPIVAYGSRLHLLVSHPTPPVFDGPEDRNGRRNHDEVAFWVKYLSGVPFTDDAGVTAALDERASAVVLGDLNADPHDGDSFGLAINRLLAHPRLDGMDRTPRSDGAVEAAAKQGGVNAGHAGPAEFDTADFPDESPRGPGNLRVDYVLPPATGAEPAWRVLDAGVFWPAEGQPGAEAARASDHRLVWVDLAVPAEP